MQKKLRALLVGYSYWLMSGIPHLLTRAGFSVDVITNHNNPIKDNRHISNLTTTKNNLIKTLDEIDLNQYDFIIPSDDKILAQIKNSDLDLEKKLKLLPITEEKFISHITSRVEFVNVMQANKIKTPQFYVAHNFEELKNSAIKLGFPVMVKGDIAGDGLITNEYNNVFDLNKIETKFFDTRVLVQKKISGTEYDLSSLFRDQKLISFTVATVIKSIKKFGPSSVRTYYQTTVLGKKIFDELNAFGKALGANGFVNIAAIKSDEDGEFYFIEGDMRPISWTDYTKFIGDDLAPKITKWFHEKKALEFSSKLNPNYPSQMVMANFLRLPTMDVLLNRYNVWRFMSKDDFVTFTRKLIQQINSIFSLKK